MKVNIKDLKSRFPEFEYMNCDETLSFIGFSHDSRTIKEGDLYIPIVGEKFDGHLFIRDALENGAVVALSESGKFKNLDGLENSPLILVDSIQEGLQKILNFSISDITSPVVAITGSTGKTTTRQMLSSILKKEMKVLSSDHTNTVWGNAVLLSQYKDEEVIVLECGMDRKGEIAWHVNSVDPDLGILLNVGHVHGEQVGGIEDIYNEKKDLADYMERTGKPLILNIDDEWLVKIKDGYREDAELLTFGKSEEADFQILGVDVDRMGTHFSFKYYDNVVDVNLKALGEGYVYNAMAAIIAANTLGIPMERCVSGISDFENNSGRFEKLEYGKNLVIINDAYNANPTSMEMAIKTFNDLYSDYHRIAILGDMKELGEVSEQKHVELGEYVGGYSFDEIFYIGDRYESFGLGERMGSVDEVAAYLNIRLEELKNQKVAILLKSSNSIGLYQLPDFLKKLGTI